MSILKLLPLKLAQREEVEVLELCIKNAEEYARECYEEPILSHMTLDKKPIIDLCERVTLRYKVDSMDACLKAANAIAKKFGLEELYSDKIKKIRNMGYNNFVNSRFDFVKIAILAGYNNKKIDSILNRIWRYAPQNRDLLKEWKEVRKLLGYTY